MKFKRWLVVLVVLPMLIGLGTGGSALAGDPIVLGCPLSTAFLYGWAAER